MLNSYVQQIKNALSSYRWIDSVEFLRFETTETDLEYILLYRIRIIISQKGYVEAFERLTENKDSKKLERTKYHFHWQDDNNQLIKRWDNAPHHPEVKTFPDHVHIGPNHITQANKPQTLLDVLDEIGRFLWEKET